MKIVLCGKGGCGKSMLSTLLAREYERMGKKVLVVDMDESNFGLYRQLGVELPEDMTHFFGSKKGVYKILDNENSTGNPFPERWGIEDIPAEFSSVSGNIRLVAIGKIHEAGEGCACAMGTVAKTFLANLKLGEEDVVIVDSEAGVEHFGRGVDREADHILAVIDPSFESIQLSGKIYDMAAAFGKPVHFVINKATAEQAEVVKKALAHPESVIGFVPTNNDLLMKGLMGEKIEVQISEVAEICKVIG